MKCCNLLILFMISLKCGTAEEPTNIKITDENVTNSEVFSASTKEDVLVNIYSSNESNESENLSTSDSDDDAFEAKEKEFNLPISRRLVQQGTRIVKGIAGSLIKGLSQPNKTDSEEDTRVDDGSENTINNLKSDATYDDIFEFKTEDEPTTSVFFSTVENVTNIEVSGASTTEALENIVHDLTELPIVDSSTEAPAIVNNVTKATDVTAVSPFTKKEFVNLPIPIKLPRYRTRTVTNIIGSLMEGLAKLNEPILEEDEGTNNVEQSTVNYFTIINATVNKDINGSTTEAPENVIHKWTQLWNINSSRDAPIIENTVIKPAVFNAISSFTNNDFGKLAIPIKPLRQSTRKVVKIIGNLMEELAKLNEPDSEEDVRVENITNSEISNATITEGPKNISENWTQLPNTNSSSITPGNENTLIKATGANFVSPFTKKEFGILPIPSKQLQHRKWTKIIGSLMDGLARLNEEDSTVEDNVEKTALNCISVENITNSEVYSASTTEASDNIVENKIRLSNTSSSSEPNVSHDNTLTHATDTKVGSPFEKEIGKLPIPIRLPGSQLMKNIIGNLAKGLGQGTDWNKDSE